MGSEIGDRFTVHYRSTHGSWLNQAESKLGSSPGNASGVGESPACRPYPREARAWNRRMNQDCVKFQRKCDRKAARCKCGYQRTPFKRSQAFSSLPEG
jgi:hypothetical protein